MSAKVHFDRWCEPTQFIAAAIGYEEGGVRQIRFGCDGLHCRIVQPAVQRTHRCRIAAEYTTGEGIHLVQRDFHWASVARPELTALGGIIAPASDFARCVRVPRRSRAP